MASRVSGRCVFCGLGISQPTENFSKISKAEEIKKEILFPIGNNILTMIQFYLNILSNFNLVSSLPTNSRV